MPVRVLEAPNGVAFASSGIDLTEQGCVTGSEDRGESVFRLFARRDLFGPYLDVLFVHTHRCRPEARAIEFVARSARLGVGALRARRTSLSGSSIRRAST